MKENVMALKVSCGVEGEFSQHLARKTPLATTKCLFAYGVVFVPVCDILAEK